VLQLFRKKIIAAPWHYISGESPRWDRFARHSRHSIWWKTHMKISKKNASRDCAQWRMKSVQTILSSRLLSNAIFRAMHYKHSNVQCLCRLDEFLYGDNPLTGCPSRQPSHALLHYGLCAYRVNTFNVLWTMVQCDKKINVDLCGGGGGGDQVV